MAEHTKGQGTGWLEFAGIFYLVAAAFNLIAGLSGLLKEELFDETRLVFGGVQDWGALWLAIGVAQLFMGIAVLRRRGGARVPAVILAVIGMLVWFVMWSVSPFLGLVMMIVYGVIIYALTAFREYFQ